MISLIVKKFYSDPPAEEQTIQASVDDLTRKRQQATALRDRAYLIVLSGTNVGEMYTVENEMVVGRGGDVGIRIIDDGASRRHAKLAVGNDGVTIQDLGSSNGTLVNGEPVEGGAISLRDGDKITIGSTTILKFTYGDNLDESFQRQMFDAARRDGLTKTFNKRYLLERLESEMAYARRHRAPLTLVMFDVDHFKAVNDTHGHPAGDAVLIRLAAVAAGAIRQEDILARYGGEEFAVLSRGVGAAGGGVLAERLRSLVGSAEVEHGGTRLRVTISAGVAEVDDLVRDGNALIARADECLYAAKRGGRNRVVVAATR
jgi:diguanylate cyclase (GGDEF)-like protein